MVVSKINFFKFFKILDYEFNQFLDLTEVNEINFSEYKDIFNASSFKEISHIQSPGYYLKKENTIYLKLTRNNNLLAIVSLIKKRFIFNLLSIARINSGPLIIEEFSEQKYFILKAILKYVSLNYSRFISFTPSYIYSNINLITSFNTIRLGLPPNNTYVLDLQKSEKEIYNNLKSNWRNGLKKGLRLTKVEEVNDPKKINSILEEYKNYAKKMNFKQISYEKITTWLRNPKINKGLVNLRIYKAYKLEDKLEDSKESLGSIGILFFKNKSLYLFGYTTQAGRKYQANVSMLWYSIKSSKENGYIEFDLGGINSKTKKGIVNFKKGLNGKLKKGTGEFIYLGIF